MLFQGMACALEALACCVLKNVLVLLGRLGDMPFHDVVRALERSGALSGCCDAPGPICLVRRKFSYYFGLVIIILEDVTFIGSFATKI